MDTKKKEQIGNFYRHGSLYTTAEVQTFDHDFVRFSEGLIIPHAIYDLQLNSRLHQHRRQSRYQSVRLW